MPASCLEALPQPPPVTFLILVSCISLYRSYSICTTLATSHKYAAVYLEIPTSYSRWKIAKSTLVLFERGGGGGAHSGLKTEKVAQHSEIGSVPQTQKGGGGVTRNDCLKVGQESIKSSPSPRCPPSVSPPASTFKTDLESVG